MTLTYRLGDKLYLNITNKCGCACEFCIRNEGDGVGDGNNLWLAREPTAAEVIAALKTHDLQKYREIVFCGYGEPTENLDVLIETARYLQNKKGAVPVRLNTNGLCDLSHNKSVAPMLEGLIDVASISLNAPDAKRYQVITHSCFGAKSFDAMLQFAGDCKKYIPSVIFSVVNVLAQDEIERCRKLAENMDIPLRVREMM